MTLGVLAAIRAKNLVIPADIALVAVDDPPWAALVDPPLTVVAQPVQKIAATAIALLLARLDGLQSDPVRTMLPLELRIRESCGMKTVRPRGRSS
jgi:LacI family transcriptional regulator